MNSEASMVVQRPPAIPKIERISPTIYEAALKCVARASWEASGDRHRVPAQPRALLGIAAHAVFEHARGVGLLGDTGEERIKAGENLFDETVKTLFEKTHPLIRAKFETHEHIPFFNIYRARTTQQAARIEARHRYAGGTTEQNTSATHTLVESRLVSKDKRVVGRPDVIDAHNATIVEYKTGAGPDGESPSDSEMRQLRLYAFIARENGIAIRRGIIERTSGDRDEVEISQTDAETEGKRARELLDEYNRHVGRSFSEAATPSAEACRYCPCIAFCPAFWEASEPNWETECGAQVEGTVESVEGGSLVSIHLKVSRGSGPRGQTVVTKFSRDWLTLDQMNLPRTSEIVRVTDAAHVPDTSSPVELRADRDMTAVWRMRSSQ